MPNSKPTKKQTANLPDPVKVLADLLKQAAPLADLITSDEYSDKDRRRLVSLVNSNPSAARYYRLLAKLNVIGGPGLTFMAKANQMIRDK